jgi:hypothetical protein
MYKAPHSPARTSDATQSPLIVVPSLVTKNKWGVSGEWCTSMCNSGIL